MDTSSLCVLKFLVVQKKMRRLFILLVVVALVFCEPIFPKQHQYTVTSLTYSIKKAGMEYFGTYYVDAVTQRYRLSMNDTSGAPGMLNIYYFATTNDLYYVYEQTQECSKMPNQAIFTSADFDVINDQLQKPVYVGEGTPRVWKDTRANVWNVTMADTFPAVFYADASNGTPLEIDEQHTIYVDVVFVNFARTVADAELQVPAICNAAK